MKILVHTLDSNTHFEYFRRYFSDSISKEHEVIHFVSQPEKVQTRKTWDSIKERVFKEKRLYKMAKRNDESVEYALNRVRMILCKKYKTAYDKQKADYIGNYFDNLIKNHPEIRGDNIFYIKNINEESDRIKSISPDLFIVVGAPIIRSNILDLVDNKINLHIGYLPYYRGILCNEHAFLKGDTNKIGYTIHELTNELDKGWVFDRKSYCIDEERFHIGAIYVNSYLDSFKKIVQYVGDQNKAKQYVNYENGQLYNSYMFNPNNYKLLLEKCFNEI